MGVYLLLTAGLLFTLVAAISPMLHSNPVSQSIGISILCVGDSLTTGFNQEGMRTRYPYSANLKALLEDEFGDSATFEGIERGVSGELVTRSMVNRTAKLLQSRPSNDTFDIVVHLGGTNDIEHSTSDEAIRQSLSTIYGMI